VLRNSFLFPNITKTELLGIPWNSGIKRCNRIDTYLTTHTIIRFRTKFLGIPKTNREAAKWGCHATVTSSEAPKIGCHGIATNRETAKWGCHEIVTSTESSKWECHGIVTSSEEPEWGCYGTVTNRKSAKWGFHGTMTNREAPKSGCHGTALITSTQKWKTPNFLKNTSILLVVPLHP
jgi:hypothetical protein